MKLFNIFKIRAATPKDKSGWFVRWAQAGFSNDVGVSINNQSAMQLSTYYDCLRIISEDVAKLPLQVFQRQGEERVKRPDHRLYTLLNSSPNPEMTAISFRQALTAHAINYGNGFAEVIRNANGDIDSLWILPPDRMKIDRTDSGELVYEYQHPDGQKFVLPRSRILHIPGFSFDGIQGYNLVSYAKQSLGLIKGAESFGSKYFANGAKTSGVVEIEKEMSEKAFNNLQKSVNDQISGDNVHKLLLLEDGAKFKQVSLSPQDSQFLETRQFGIAEICRWFRMPPHKVADLTRATFSNIEHQSLEYVGDTLMPWFTRWEQAIATQLIQEPELYVKHNANALLRGDTKTRYEAYGKAINDGWMTRNEVRSLEELNPLDGLDEPLQPLNMTKANEAQQEFENDIANRVANAEIRAIKARADKAIEDRDKFNEWVKSFYQKHSEYVAKAFKPLNLENLTDVVCESGLSQITNAVDVNELINTWDRAGQIKRIIEDNHV